MITLEDWFEFEKEFTAILLAYGRPLPDPQRTAFALHYDLLVLRSKKLDPEAFSKKVVRLKVLWVELERAMREAP